MAFTLQAFASDTLAADITDSASSMTLSTGSFGTPSGEQMLVIDYNIAAKREIVKCTIDGTAVTSMTRAQDGTAAVAHTSGAKIIMAFVPSHYSGLTDGTALAAGAITDAKLATKLKAGWDLLAASGTRVSNTQMTVTGDITDRLWVGKPLELTDTTTKYFNITSFSYSSPNTTINFTGGTDYVLVGNPTNIYGGLHNSPVGFPHAFATAIGYVRFEGGTMIQYGSLAITCPSGSDNTAGTINFPAGLNFADTKYTFTHSGVNSTNFATANEMPFACHSTHTAAQAVVTLFARSGTWAANRNTTVKWRAEGKI